MRRSRQFRSTSASHLEYARVNLSLRAILNNLCDITGDALGDRIGRLMGIFDKRSLDPDKMINPVNMNERIAKCPRHEGIDFCDDHLGMPHTHSNGNRDAQTDEAVRVRR